MDSGIQQGDLRIEHVGGNAGAANRHAGRAREQHRAHDIGCEAWPDAHGARLHGTLLVRGEVVGGDRLAGIGAQRGIDAVDRRVRLRKTFDDGARGHHAFACGGGKRDRCSGARHANNVGDRDARAGKDDAGCGG